MGLTVKEIDSAKPSDKSYKLADSGGLCLLVAPSGAKLWRWRYRFDGKEKMMALGEYPLVTLNEARERHFTVRKSWLLAWILWPNARQKPTPNRGKPKRDNVKLRIASRMWPANGGNGGLSGSLPSRRYLRRRLEADVFPAFGHKFIDVVTAADVRELMLSIERRDARDVAKRAHETTSQIFRYAIARDIAGRNPAADFKPRDILAEARTENRNRVDAKELPELLAKMDDYNGDAITRFAMKLMEYTFVRTSEQIEAPWTEFDLDEARWIIPSERMKMNTPHVVPLSRQATEVLKALKLLTGNGKLVFPGANDKKKPMSNNTILYALYRLGYRDRMTGHGFRGLLRRF